MIDCGDDTMRDLLPLFARDALTADETVRVREHAATCASCAAELALLGAAARVFAEATPRVDVAAIQRRLTAAGADSPVLRIERPAAHRFVMPQYVLAAAASLVLVAALSFDSLRALFDGTSGVDGGEIVVVDSGPIGPSMPVEILGAGGLSELGSDELRALLAELDRMEVTISAEPASNRHPVTTMPEGI